MHGDLCRRIQAIADAHLVPGRVDWSNGRFFAGVGDVGDAVTSSLRQWAARRAKDEAEIENARDRARALQSKAILPGDAAPAAATPKQQKPGPKRSSKLGGASPGAPSA